MNCIQDREASGRFNHGTTPHAMRHRKPKRTANSEEPKLEVSSLIDICFLLLVFFLVTSTIALTESDLDMKLPTPDGNPPVTAFEPLLIQIRTDGAIHAGDLTAMMQMDTDPTARNVPLLSGHLELYASAVRASNNTPLVRLDVDFDSSHQRLIDVLNALARVKIDGAVFADTTL